jgi:hypothetical protein
MGRVASKVGGGQGDGGNWFSRKIRDRTEMIDGISNIAMIHYSLTDNGDNG